MDPISAVSAITGLVGFAANVTSNGYRYIRAVKNCDEEVKRLVGELSSLEGLLHQIEILFEEKESEETQNGRTLGVPKFYYEVSQTLKKISDVLRGFYMQTSADANPGTDPSKESVSSIQATQSRRKKRDVLRLLPLKLRWPLDRTETLALIDSLERHKNTCLIALTTLEWESARDVLGLTRRIVESTVQLHDEIGAVRELLEQELQKKNTQKILEWLAPHDPTPKYRQSREVHQIGTGEWLFDHALYNTWLATPNAGLWIYGIPGAGKTVLNSSIVERLFDQQRSGTAFFYCQYQVAASQRALNILGWWIVSLARESLLSLERVKAFYDAHHQPHKLAKAPTLSELESLLISVSGDFEQTTLILDGLDECGVSLGIEREDLTSSLARLQRSESGRIRVLVTSRDLADIRKHFGSFKSFPLYAESADLWLYVTTELNRRSTKLRFRDESFKSTVIEELINGSQGMFMWCKCQIDYLCTLPTDRARRDALKKLPPDLPATYVRILEVIDRDFSHETTVFIRRALKWIALEQSKHDEVGSELTLPALVHAISIDPDSPPIVLDLHTIPHVDDVVDWLGSLVRANAKHNTLEFAHYTVKEFLESDPAKVDSVIARKYLVRRGMDVEYLAQTSLTYLTLSNFDYNRLLLKNITITELLKQYPFYGHAAWRFSYYVSNASSGIEESVATSRFFSVQPTSSFLSWTSFLTEAVDRSEASLSGSWLLRERPRWRPLQIAAALLLDKTAKRLLREGAKPNAASDMVASPLHWVIEGPYRSGTFHDTRVGSIDSSGYDENASVLPTVQEIAARRNHLVDSLLDAGADVNLLSMSEYYLGGGTYCQLAPLPLAILHCRPDIVKSLIERGAIHEPTPGSFGQDYTTLKTILKVLVKKSSFYNTTAKAQLDSLIATLFSLPGLEMTISEFLVEQAPRPDMQTYEETKSKTVDESRAERVLMAAAMHNNMHLMDWAISNGAYLDSTTYDQTAMWAAVRYGHSDMVAVLEAKSASRYVLGKDHMSAIVKAYSIGGVEYASSIFPAHVDISLPEWHKLEVLMAACAAWDIELAKFITELGIEPNHDRNLDFDEEHPVTDTEILRLAHRHNLLSLEYRRKTFYVAWSEGMLDLAEYLITTAATDDLLDSSAPPKLTASNHCVFKLIVTVDGLTDTAQELILRDAVDEKFNELRVMLLSKIENHEWKDYNGNSLLHCACATGDVDTIEVVLQAGFKSETANKSGQTPAHIAVEAGREEILDLLMEHDISLSTLDASKRTTLHAVFAAVGSVQSLSDDVASRLCAKLMHCGADPNVRAFNFGNTALHEAVYYDCPQTISVLLSGGADPLLFDPQGLLPIHMAAASGFAAVIEALALSRSQQMKLDMPTSKGFTALHIAAERGQREACRALLAAGATIDIKAAPGGVVPLHLAAEYGHHDIVAVLLDAYDNTDVQDSAGQTPIMKAAKHGHRDCVAVLLDAHADVNVRDSFGETAFVKAVCQGHTATAEILLEFRANQFLTDHQGYSALHFAAGKGFLDILSHFVSAGVFPNLNITGDDGSTALHHAVSYGRQATAQVLIEAGANLNVRDKSGATPLDYGEALDQDFVRNLLREKGAEHGAQASSHIVYKAAVKAVQDGNMQQLDRLLRRGVNVDSVKSQTKISPLLSAASLGRLDMVKMLHQSGSDIFATYNGNGTSLICAAPSGNIELCKYLVDNGVDPFAADIFGQTALHLSCFHGHARIVKFLLDTAQFTQARLSDYAEPLGTPLAAAASHGRLEIVRYLVDAGAPLEGRQVCYGTALIAACVCGQLDVVKFLVQAGARIGPFEGRFHSAIEAAESMCRGDVLEYLKGLEQANTNL